MKRVKMLTFIIVGVGFMLGLILLTSGRGTAVHAANFTVNSVIDAVDSNPGDGACATSGNVCTLRAAIQEANALAGSDVITVPAGTYTLTLVSGGSDTDATGDLDITDDLTLSGSGVTATYIDGNQIDRVFYIASGVNVQITDVTIQNGNSSFGSGIYNWGTLTVQRSAIVNNQLSGAFYAGGGIDNIGTITIMSSTIHNNQTPGDANGGGLFNQGQATITDTSITSNTAGSGSGIYNSTSGAVLQLENVTIANNSAAGSGGGIVNNNGTATVNNLTIVNNTADSDNNSSGDGGGIFADGGTLNIANSIIAENIDMGDESPDCGGLAGTIVSAGHNFVGKNDGCNWSSTTGDQVGTIASPLDPQLDTLTGSPAYYPLLASSPVIDAGDPAAPGGAYPACAASDQVGTVRPVDGDGDSTAVCDIGAYEWRNQVKVYLPTIIK